MTRRSTTDRHRNLVRAARREIVHRYKDPDLSLAEVAEAVGSSERQLQRVLRERTGFSFRETLLELRMRKARTLLERGLAVRVVARRVGYRQASGLGQAFRRAFGEPPSAAHPPPLDYDIEWRRREAQFVRSGGGVGTAQ